jgi:hypothetical protein
MSSAASDQRRDEPAVPGARASVVSARTGRRRQLLLTWAPILVVAALAALLNGLHVAAYHQLGVQEPHQVDYVNRLLDGEIPAAGDEWEPETTEAVTCRTVDTEKPARPRCGAPIDAAKLPDGGMNESFMHAPLYYAVATGAVRLSDAIGPALDDVDAMRATGALWSVAALGLMWALWRSLGVPWQARAGLWLALVATPTVLMAQSTVTPGATALASGAAVTLATLRWDAGRVGLWLPVATMAVVLLLEATNLAVVLAAAVFVLFRAGQLQATTRERLRGVLSLHTLAFVGAAAAATAVARIGWSLIWRARADPDVGFLPENGALIVDSFDPGWLTNSLLALVTPIQPESYQSILEESAVPVIVAQVAHVGLLVLALIGAVHARPGSVLRALGVGAGVAALSFGALLSVLTYLSDGTAIGIPPWNGLSLVPGALAVAGWAVKASWAARATLVVGGLFYAGMAWKVLL